jgi:hypothetical protein
MKPVTAKHPPGHFRKAKLWCEAGVVATRVVAAQESTITTWIVRLLAGGRVQIGCSPKAPPDSGSGRIQSSGCFSTGIYFHEVGSTASGSPVSGLIGFEGSGITRAPVRESTNISNSFPASVLSAQVVGKQTTRPRSPRAPTLYLSILTSMFTPFIVSYIVVSDAQLNRIAIRCQVILCTIRKYFRFTP